MADIETLHRFKIESFICPLEPPLFGAFFILKIMTEEWKRVKGFENYSVSDFGKVRNNKTGKYLKLFVSKKDYQKCRLHKNGICKKFLIHRIEMVAFVGDSSLEVNHKDGNKLNNNLSNLEYVTSRENRIHAANMKKKTSKYTGVYFHKSSGKWAAQINFNKKNIYLGIYQKEEEAHKAYLAFRRSKNITSKY